MLAAFRPRSHAIILALVSSLVLTSLLLGFAQGKHSIPVGLVFSNSLQLDVIELNPSLSLKLNSPSSGAVVTVTGEGGAYSEALFNQLEDNYRYGRDDVTLTYERAGTETALTHYAAGLLDYSVIDAAFPAAVIDYYGVEELPFAGQPIVIAYNLNSTQNQSLVLDSDTLGSVWVGNIVWWNDSAIAALNDGLVLPEEKILLVRANDTLAGISRSFTNAMSVFNAEFNATWRSTLSSAASDWRRLTKIANRTTPVSTGEAQVATVKATPFSMTYTTPYFANLGGVPYARMRNNAGVTLTATVEAVESAMEEVYDLVNAGNLAVDVNNGSLPTSWPMCMLSFAVFYVNQSRADCSQLTEFIEFFAWAQLNQRADELMRSLGYAPLSLAYKAKCIAVLQRVVCDATNVSSPYLLGEGPAFNVYTGWANDYPSTTYKLKYFTAGDNSTYSDLASGIISFGTTNVALSESSSATKRQAASMSTIPSLGYAIGAAYYVPGLPAGAELVFDINTLASIYTGAVDRWDHPAILNLNPELAGSLPNSSITVVCPNFTSEVTLIFTEAFSKVNSLFASTVGVSDQIACPGVATDDVVGTIAGTSNSLSMWTFHEVVQNKRIDFAKLHNADGDPIAVSSSAIASAINDYGDQPDATALVLGNGTESWPIVGMSYFALSQHTTGNCAAATALIDWVFWSQTNDAANRLATRNGMAVASRSAKGVSARMLNFVGSVTCEDGVKASSYAGCIYQGTLCSDRGLCTEGACVCTTDGYEGEHCEIRKSSSDGVPLAAILGSVIPVVALLLLVLVCILVAFFLFIERRTRRTDDWELDINELDMGDQLGIGGHGVVHKAIWKGTEVAVKMMAASAVTRELERNFKEEVRVMTALRHPNVVLFMAACTKPPKLCIVMEFMALGSLFELLHNELIPDLPGALRIRMAYQTAKGMHFLHSSGIVHRDLKSLNLLLDTKWNIKVSDFGLTKFKEELKRGHTKLGQGSIHWTAPEVLNECHDIDYALADVYSFGIILWELLTRDQPFLGLSQAAVAVAVIRDGARPAVPATTDMPPEFVELMLNSWHEDSSVRPSFLEAMTRLSAISEDTGTFTKSSSSLDDHVGGGYTNSRSASNTQSTNTTNTNSSASSSGSHHRGKGWREEARPPPEGEVTVVFSDITRAASLWEFNPEAMRDATVLHNEILRGLLRKCQGYEIAFHRDRNSGEGSFCMAFQHTKDAIDWCIQSQIALVQANWPEALLQHPGAAEEWADTDDRVIYKGLRVRMGVHVGHPRVVRDAMTRRAEYIGPAINASARITAMAHGGQVLMSEAAFNKLKDTDISKETNRIICLGRFDVPSEAPGEGAKLYEVKIRGLESRFFGGVTLKDAAAAAESSSGTGGSTDHGHQNDDEELHTFVGEGMQFKEDTYLTSANLCRWVIDFHEVQLGKQIGMGSYGVVYRGKWKGVDVAVKKFIKQKLDERRMLEFRAEMAFLSELHHPNIVLFIGACVRRPNLCIMTEFVKLGCLKGILADNTIKLSWHQKVKLLRSAALGITYLHSLHPVIVHRDLKPSNLLVDETWNVKVADFGLARIKEENATMTRCGTPCWTAPEIIRGDKYGEKADVYSFGIIMWEVLTRRQPFAGRNFMGVSLDVLEGRRPQIPQECPPAFKKLMNKCWHADPLRRPNMEDALARLQFIVGDDEPMTP